MMAHLTTMFSIVVFIPIIAAIYLTITKKLRVKPIICGILCYGLMAILTEVVLTLLNLAFSGFIAKNAFLTIGLWGIITPLFAVFITIYIYKKVMAGDAGFRDSLGYGLGIGSVWMIMTVGTTLFFSMVMSMTLADGGIESETAEMTAEAIEAYNAAKENFTSKSLLDYILLTVSGITLAIVTAAVSVLTFEYTKTSDKKMLFIALGCEIAVFVPFLLAVNGGFVNIFVQAFMVLLAAGGVWYMITEAKKYPSAEKIITERPSPLAGRDFTRRIKKRK